MAGFTDYFEEKLLEHAFTGNAYVKPATWYVTAFTVAPTDSTPGTEAAGGSWGGRKAVAFGEYVSGGVPSTNEVTFVMPAATIVAIGLMNASSGGNLCSYKVLSPSKTYADGESVIIAVGDLIQALD